MRLALSLATAALLSSSLAAHADVYQLFGLANSSGSVDNIGFVDNGNGFVVSLNFGCDGNTFNCFRTTIFGQGSSTISGTQPLVNQFTISGDYSVSYTPGPSGTFHDGDVNVENDATGFSSLAYQGNAGGFEVDPFGDVAFYGYTETPFGIGDENIVAFDETTHAAYAASVTPEPASFALFGTGLLGIAGVIRKRLA